MVSCKLFKLLINLLLCVFVTADPEWTHYNKEDVAPAEAKPFEPVARPPQAQDQQSNYWNRLAQQQQQQKQSQQMLQWGNGGYQGKPGAPPSQKPPMRAQMWFPPYATRFSPNLWPQYQTRASTATRNSQRWQQEAEAAERGAVSNSASSQNKQEAAPAPAPLPAPPAASEEPKNPAGENRAPAYNWPSGSWNPSTRFNPDEWLAKTTLTPTYEPWQNQAPLRYNYLSYPHYIPSISFSSPELAGIYHNIHVDHFTQSQQSQQQQSEFQTARPFLPFEILYSTRFTPVPDRPNYYDSGSYSNPDFVQPYEGQPSASNFKTTSKKNPFDEVTFYTLGPMSTTTQRPNKPFKPSYNPEFVQSAPPGDETAYKPYVKPSTAKPQTTYPTPSYNTNYYQQSGSNSYTHTRPIYAQAVQAESGKPQRIYKPFVTVPPNSSNWTFSTRFSPHFQTQGYKSGPGNQQDAFKPYQWHYPSFYISPWQMMNRGGLAVPTKRPVYSYPTGGYYWPSLRPSFSNEAAYLPTLQTTPTTTTAPETTPEKTDDLQAKDSLVNNSTESSLKESEVEPNTTQQIRPPPSSIEEIVVDDNFFSNLGENKTRVAPPVPLDSLPTQEPFDWQSEITFRPLPSWPPAGSKPPATQATWSPKPSSQPSSSSVAITPRPTAYTWSWINRTTTTGRPVSSDENAANRPTTTSPPPQFPPMFGTMTTGRIKITTTTKAATTTSSNSSSSTEALECGKNVYMSGGGRMVVADESNDTLLSPQFSQDIVGGTDARKNEFPWQVRINYRNGFVCGGAIISNRHILTAAHCIITNTPALYQLILGDHSRSDVDNGEVTISVAKIFLHPGYSNVTNQFDIAVMETATEIVYDKVAIRPICLPDASMLPKTDDGLAGQTAVISGWGKLREGGGIPKILQKATVPILPQADCIRSYRTSKFSQDMMCAGNGGGSDTCQGDSGGPLVILSNNRYYIYGVTSWGYGCARPKYPGVYARVSSSLEWIIKNIA